MKGNKLKEKPILIEVLSVYGFGSFFSEDTKYEDIDILIIHENIEYKSCQFAINCKEIFISKRTEADITILSKSEESLNSFVFKSSARLLGEISSASVEADVDVILCKIRVMHQLKARYL